ncbi:Kynurenine formamidase [Lobosporangium transversale]|uniref:Alpha/Beta hydrolase protein n=1 Tax=Lobosporangium transversale TaxID=64571 RepID=A0A1Y2GBA6_9FUNG|nr:Alpha/Beta hydrolase protein [Lobosporangium transversale]KAF9914014.1 Kynurenine formamidase [Lobosporangium transversale]ORZ06157.1 Alpha/Beta hydrolase protein [Lobosporangium transversale]|eukprot:XP_021877426.1 Alpha/Beta hydrolase protein [Lobosporangium transversale]
MSIIKDIVYAPVSHWEKHTLDLYYPDRQLNANKSLIVFVHGGAWRTGDKDEFVDMAQRISTSTGDVVAVVNYTLSVAAIKDDPTSVRPEAQHPKHVQDVAKAVAYLYMNAEKYNGHYNPNHIFLVGHSAGGQITGMLALRPDLFLEPIETELGLEKGVLHRAIRGVIGVEGIYNVDRILKRWPSYKDFIIQGFGGDPETLIHGSPDGQQVPPGTAFRLPNYAVLQSNEDELVEPEQAKEYHAHLLAVAGPSEDKVILEFGDWGKHDAMLQTEQFAKTITKYVHGWEAQ